MKFKTRYGEWDVGLVIDKYASNNNLAIELVDKITYEPIARMTVNVIGLIDGYCAIDTNNCPEMVEFIENYNLGTRIGLVPSGYCIYPIYEINMEEVKKYSV